MNNPRMKMTAFELAGKRHNERIGVIKDVQKYLSETIQQTLAHRHSVLQQEKAQRGVYLQHVLRYEDAVRRGVR